MVRLVLQAPAEPMAQLVRLVLRARRATLAQRVRLAQQVRLAPQVRLAQQERTAPTALQGLPAQPE